MIHDYLVEKGHFTEDELKGLKKKQLTEKLVAVRPQRKVIVDELLKAAGILPVRLPPYFCTYNPIENIWSSVKCRFKEANTGKLKTNEAIALVEKICDQPDFPKMWKNACDSVIRREEKDRPPFDPLEGRGNVIIQGSDNEEDTTE